MPPKKYSPEASKEAIVIIMDVGKSITDENIFEEVKKTAILMIKNKIRYAPKCEVGFVLVGSKESNTDYKNVNIYSSMKIVDLELFSKIDEIEDYGKYSGDLFDSLNVATDMIVAKCKKLKYKRRIFLITDFINKMKGDDTFIETCKGLDIQLDIVSIKKGILKEENDPRMINEKKFEKICSKLNGVIIPIDLAISSLHSLKSKKVSSRTTFRGLFEITPDLKIPIWMYKKTDKTGLPSLKKMSNKSEDGEIMIDKTYYSIDDPDLEIQSDDLIKAYKYGNNFIPFNQIDLKMLSLETEKSFQLIGFTDRDNIPRNHFLSTIYQIISEPFQEESQIALSSLIKGLAEMNRVGIIRYVFRNNSNPSLGVLLPVIKNNQYCFYFSLLPFSEDIRRYPFKSFEKIKLSLNQLESTEEFINSMNLNDDDLKPSETFHPNLQHFLESCHSKLLYPNQDLPEIDDQILKYCFPEKSKDSCYSKLIEKSKDILEKFSLEFPLEKNEKKEKKRYWFSMNNENEINLESYKKKRVEEIINQEEVDDRILEKIEIDINSSKVNKIGTKDPIKDFKEMYERRDIDLVDSAIEQLQNIIIKLINDSINDQYFEKSLNCLIELRLVCLKEEEIDKFNNFLLKLKSLFLKNDFWNLLKNSKINLISQDESGKSEITKQDLDNFYKEEEKEEKVLEVVDDDLFNEID